MDPDDLAAGGAPGGNPPPPPSPPPQAPQPPPMQPRFAAFLQGQRSPQVSAPGPGDQAHGMVLLQQVMDIAQRALPLVMGMPAHSELARFVERMSRMLSKGGGVPLGVQQTAQRDQAAQTQKMAALQQFMAMQQGRGGQGGQPQQPPMPSGAFPGA